MKINVEVDLQDLVEDMQSNERYDLSEAIKSQISYAVAQKVSSMAQASVEKLLSERITPQVNQIVEAKVSSALDHLIAVGELNIRGNTTSIKEYVENCFMNNTGWSSPSKQIEKIAKEFGNEMKMQYNNIFAMNIVKNLSEQGLLNEDVAKALLAPPKN